MYMIIDLQVPGRYFAGGALFKNKVQIVDQLADYHDIDFSGTDDKGNKLSIKEYFKFWKIDTVQKQLDFLLEHGDWKLEKVDKKEMTCEDCRKCGENTCGDDTETMQCFEPL
jgi:hypothetical protein